MPQKTDEVEKPGWEQSRDAAKRVYESKRQGIIEGSNQGLRDMLKADEAKNPDWDPEQRQVNVDMRTEGFEKKLKADLGDLDGKYLVASNRLAELHGYPDVDKTR